MVSVLAICVWLSSSNTSYPIIFAAPALGIITLFGVLWATTDITINSTVSDTSMRSAIAASAVVMYMVLVGFGVFTDEKYGGMSTMAQTLLTNFTTVVGIIVAFYFGTSAYLEGQVKKTKKDDDSKNNMNKT
jgi:hypothetical protein